MKGNFNIIIVLVTSILFFGQRTYSQITKDNYGTEIKENFKKLDFNWTLTPQCQEVLDSGLNSLSKAEWKPALEFFDRVIEFDSTFVPAYYFRFSCYEVGNRNTTDKAYNNLRYVIKKLPRTTRSIYTDLWDAYVGNTKHLRRNNPLLEIAPPLLNLSNYLIQHEQDVKGESLTYLKQAFSNLVIAKPNEAILLSNKSIALQPSTSALYIKAIAFQLSEQHDSAFYLFNEIVKNDERVIEAHENLALYKNQLNNKVGVSKHLIFLNQIEPDSPYIWRFSGLLKSQIQDYYGAIVDLTKYLKIDPTNFDCLKQRAIAEFRVKNYQNSLSDLNSALKLSDRDLDIFLYLSENYILMGDSIKCITILRDAKEVFSFSQDLDLFTANKLVEVNKTKQAQEIIDRVVRVVLLNHFDKKYLHQANLIQCKIFLRKGAYDKALDKVNDLISKEGEHLDYFFLRAEIYLKKGDTARAKTDLEKLVKEGFQPAIDLYNSL